jgi:hypothetical protein
MALRLIAVCGLALVVAASAFAGTPTKASRCLKAHHVLVAAKSPKSVTKFGVHVEKLESFSFHGVPAKVYDNGTLIFEKNAAAALKAKNTLYSRFAAFEVKHSPASPYRIRLDLRNTEVVVGNVLVVWNNYPQKAVAKRTLFACLR